MTDSEWAFAVFLSSLPDPEAKKFSTEVLRQAMLDTIAKLNSFVEEAGGDDEVRVCVGCFYWDKTLTDLAAQSHELLCDGWGDGRGDEICVFKDG